MKDQWLEKLWKLGTQLGTTLDLDHEVSLFKEEVVKSISPHLLLIFLSDDKKDLLHLKAAYGVDRKLEPTTPMRANLRRWLSSQGIALPGEKDPRFYMIPITIEKQILGVVCVLSSLPLEETDRLEEEVEFVKSAVNYLAPIIRNIQQYTTQFSRMEFYLNLIADFSRRLSSQGDVESLIERVLNDAPEMLGVERCTLLTVGEDERYLIFRATSLDPRRYGFEDISGMRMPIKGKLEEALRSDEPMVLKDLDELPNAEAREIHRRFQIKTALAVPLAVDDERIGLIVFDSPGKDRDFEQADKIFARAVAQIVAVALYRIRTIETMRRDHQEELRLMRLKSLGEMASGVVHDFNNALSGVLGYLQLLKTRLTDPQLRRFAEMAEKSAEDASAIVQRMRAFYKDQESARAIIDMNELLGDVIEMTKPRWKDMPEAKGAQIKLVTEFGDIPMVEGQEPELRQLFTNLIFNAVDAMPEGGTLTIRTYSEGNSVIVQVMDTGVGMDEETKRRIFEPFFTTKREGTGLGLSICRRIVAEHGGSIGVESSPGEGTTITVTLPAAEIFVRRGKPGEEIKQVEMRPKRVLVVDDEEVVRNVVSDMLAELGHEAKTAQSGAEGLEIFRKERFDLVMTDLGMPGMNGLQLADLLRTIDDQTPIVLLTGWGDTMDRGEARRHGIWRVVSKPVQMDELRDLIVSLPRRNGSDG